MYQNNRLQSGPTWQPANGVQVNNRPHHAHNPSQNRFNAQQQNQGWQQPNQNQSLQQTLVSLLSQLVGLLQGQQLPMQGQAGMSDAHAEQAANMNALFQQQQQSLGITPGQGGGMNTMGNGFAAPMSGAGGMTFTNATSMDELLAQSQPTMATNMDSLYAQQQEQMAATRDYQNQSAHINAWHEQEMQHIDNPLVELQPSVLPPELQLSDMGSATNMDGLLDQQKIQALASVNSAKAGKELDRLFQGQSQPNLDLDYVVDKVKADGVYGLLQLKVEDGIRSPFFQQQSPQVQAQLVSETNNIFTKYDVSKPELTQRTELPPLPDLPQPLNQVNSNLLTAHLNMRSDMEMQAQISQTNRVNGMVNKYYSNYGLNEPMPQPIIPPRMDPMQGFVGPQPQMPTNMNSFPAQQPTFVTKYG